MGQKGYSHDKFVELVKAINPFIKIIGKFTTTSDKILIECEHSVREVVAWQLLKGKKYCCNLSYHKKRVPAQLKSLSERVEQYSPIFNGKLDFSNATLGSTQKLDNIMCVKHNLLFSQWFDSLRKGIGCPQCGREKKTQAGIKMIQKAREKQLEMGVAKFISKNETKWLESLDVPIRQKWLDDVKYRVDGFNVASNTVYLYHGKFWHGCPETFDPESIHPILKVTMKELYEKTILIEKKIKEAGYNLVVQWGN